MFFFVFCFRYFCFLLPPSPNPRQRYLQLGHTACLDVAIGIPTVPPFPTATTATASAVAASSVPPFPSTHACHQHIRHRDLYRSRSRHRRRHHHVICRDGRRSHRLKRPDRELGAGRPKPPLPQPPPPPTPPPTIRDRRGRLARPARFPQHRPATVTPAGGRQTQTGANKIRALLKPLYIRPRSLKR